MKSISSQVFSLLVVSFMLLTTDRNNKLTPQNPPIGGPVKSPVSK